MDRVLRRIFLWPYSENIAAGVVPYPRPNGPRRQGQPLTLEGGPDEYKLLLGYCSDLSTLWRLQLHWCVQAFVTEDKEECGTASRAVSLPGLDPGRMVFGDLGLYLYVGGIAVPRRFKIFSRCEGVAAVEFALLLLPLVLLIGGGMDFGGAYYIQHVITNASREGARYGVKYKVDSSTGLPLAPSALTPSISDYVKLPAPTGLGYNNLLSSDANLTVVPSYTWLAPISPSRLLLTSIGFSWAACWDFPIPKHSRPVRLWPWSAEK